MYETMYGRRQSSPKAEENYRQVQAIDRMVDEDVPCEDIITQVNAAKSALHKVGQIILEATCSTASGMASNREMRKKP